MNQKMHHRLCRCRDGKGILLAVVGLLLWIPAGCGNQAASPAEAGTVAAVAGPEPTHVTEQTFAREVEQSEGVVIVDFWAPWCGPCKLIAPILDKLAGEYDGKVKICKVNVDDNQALANRFKITGIPSLILFKDGKPIDMKVGAEGERAYRKWVESHL